MKNSPDKKTVRYLLNTEEDTPPVIVALVCTLREYRLAWMLNQNFKTAFKRVADINVPLGSGNPDRGQMLLFEEADAYSGMPVDQSSHAHYTDPGKLTGIRLRLIANLGTSGWLVPERKNMDFFFLIKGELRENTLTDWINNLRSLQVISMATVLPLSSIPLNKRNYFLFD